MKILFFLLLFLCNLSSLFAKDEENFIKSFFATYENDSVYSRRDQYYSNGIQLLFFTKNIKTKENSFLSNFIKNKDFHNYSFGIGQKIYTPSDIEIPYFVENDRPYAGHLYLFLNKNLYFDNKINTFGFSFGLSGKNSLSEDVQSKIHSLIGSPEPQGWENQIKSQLLFSLNYNSTISWIETKNNKYNYDIITKFGFNLGTPITNFIPSVEFRYGYNLQKDYISNRINYTNSTFSVKNKNKIKSYFAFLELTPNFVIYNTFLDKNNLSKKNNLDIEKNWFVYDISAGLTFIYEDYYLKYSTIYTSKEFKEQNHSQVLFSLSLGYIF